MNDNIPWIEKYRPSSFESIILTPIIRNIFENMIEHNHIPNLLLYGPPGTGKTTTIINFIHKYQKKYNIGGQDTIIHLNASDERGLDVIRNQIKQFMYSKQLFGTGIKFIILDEVDSMTLSAQKYLKQLLSMIKTTNVRFILICNYLSKIYYSFQRIFLKIRFNTLPRDKVSQMLKYICDKENMNISLDYIQEIQDYFHSDIRSMINYLQQYKFINYSHKIILIQDKDICDIFNYTSSYEEFISKCKFYTKELNVSLYELLIRCIEYYIKHYKVSNFYILKECVHQYQLEPLILFKHFYYSSLSHHAHKNYKN